MSEDWLDISTEEAPQTAGLPAVVSVPTDLAERVAIVEASWAKLSLKQRVFLTAYRENGFNERKTAKKLGLSVNTKNMTKWMQESDFATVVRLWRGSAAQDALDRDRLLVRQDDIVETLLTPKPILHQGVRTGYTEVEAGAAARANETLMKAAGLLKDKEIDVNVGLVGPSLTIAVIQPNGEVKDATPKGVIVDVLPEPSDGP